MDLFLDAGSVSISRLVVGWPVAIIALEATLEHVVSRVGWIHYPGAARQKGGTGMLRVELLPSQAGMSKANHYFLASCTLHFVLTPKWRPFAAPAI